MNQQNEAQQGQMEQQPERNAHQAFSRRKFLLQASAVSVPVVLSLKSGKAWGCVELNCTPGETSLSNSGSAVASATSEKNPNAYERPQWSSMSQIISAFNVDFDDWLLPTFKAVLCTYETKRQSGRTYYRYTQLTCDMYSFNTWWNQVKKGSSALIVTNTPTSKLASNRQWVTSAPVTYNKNNSRMPANCNSVLVKGNTDASKLCPGMTGQVGAILKGGDTPEKYAIAAIIGSIWERHPEYTARYGSDKCFPEPQALIDAYWNAKAEGRLKDLHSLFKLYMSPL